ncbi:hypothetical protein ACLOJK_026308 [Asimina triloba]
MATDFPRRLSFFAFTLSLLLFLQPPSFASATQSSSSSSSNSTSFIRSTCKKTQHYDICVAALESDPRSSAADLQVYAQILIELTLANATNTYSFISKLVNETDDDDVLRMCLYDCSAVYDIGINHLRDALMFLGLREHVEVGKLAGEAGDEGVECENFFKTPPLPKSPSPLTSRNEMLEALSSISKSIVGLLV